MLRLLALLPPPSERSLPCSLTSSVRRHVRPSLRRAQLSASGSLGSEEICDSRWERRRLPPGLGHVGTVAGAL